MKPAHTLLFIVILATLLNGCALYGNRRDGARHGNRKFQDTLVTRRSFFGPHQYDHEGHWTRTLESDEWTDRGRPKDVQIAREQHRDRLWAEPRTPMP